jgi:hypothetical protein
MASWQAVYWLLPQEKPTADPEGAWIGIEGVQRILVALDNVLPRAVDWSETVLHWGEYEAHDIQAWVEGAEIEAIRVRLDLRQSDVRSVCERLIAAAGVLGAVFQADDGTAISVDATALYESSQASRAGLFVRDPQQYLATIATEPYNDR